MKANELRKKSIPELHKLVVENKKKLFKSELEIKSGKLDKQDEKINLKKDIARIKSVISEKEILKQNEKA